MTKSDKPAAPACSCGSSSAFADCCAPFLSGAQIPPTAEALMRSRYSAYTLRDEAYLLATWHHGTRPLAGLFDDDVGLTWLGLTVKSPLRLRLRKRQDARQEMHTDASKDTEVRDASADSDAVEFVARYKIGGRAHRLHEVSRFVREQGRWFYLDGNFSERLNSK
ncbi:MAG: hypothetical protein HHJ12_05485 [Glaciimonas sp.]|nr:hypothetical protein [Glaciimonas sp.]